MKEVKRSRRSKDKDIAVKIDDEIDLAFSDIDEDALVEEENVDLNELVEEIEKDIPPKPKKKRKLKKTPFVALLIVFGIFLIILLFIILFKPKISIVGEKKLKIPYNVEYNDAGATAKVLGKDVTNKIKTDNQVDTSKIGKYKVNYSVKSLLSAKKTRIVEVVDEVPPVITLEGEEDLVICPNAKFEDPGYTALDEYDGDLTDSVVVEEKDNSVIYTVSDSSKNSYSITRTLTRKDEEEPEINLSGGTSNVVILNTTYKDPGFEAKDNCSGDLTGKVTTSGKVDTTKEGTYEIKYTVSDDSGNEKTVTRKVTVQKNYPKRSSNFSCGEAGVIYLTFDDGPQNVTTPYILDILKQYDVKATFFVTNKGPDELVKREYDEGHAVALHTASHDYATVYASVDAYWNDLNKVSDRVERLTGQKSYLIRFPGGSSNTVSRHYSTGIMSRLVYDVQAKGYSYFDWNVDSTDAGCGNNCTADVVYSHVVGGLRKDRGNVVLMHDIKYHTANAIERIVKYGLEHGYTFKTLDSSVSCWHSTNN